MPIYTGRRRKRPEEFVKTSNINFRVTDEQFARLKELADNYYGGNVSLVVRKAMMRGLPLLERQELDGGVL